MGCFDVTEDFDVMIVLVEWIKLKPKKKAANAALKDTEGV
jgi:hypothetical protein